MIETHFHCLPGIDDGPPDWREAVQLCRLAASQGTHAIVATPHVLRDPWLNEDATELGSLVRELNARLDGSPRVFSGCEMFFSSDIVELWEQEGGPVIPINHGLHLLVEFPAHSIPIAAEASFHELVVAGATPVVAHPERNTVFMKTPERLERLIEIGAKPQITAGSIVGDFGPRSKHAADLFIDMGLVSVVASDAHSIRRRPPRLAAAREAVLSRWGAAVAASLFEYGPSEMLAHDFLLEEANDDRHI